MTPQPTPPNDLSFLSRSRGVELARRREAATKNWVELNPRPACPKGGTLAFSMTVFFSPRP